MDFFGEADYLKISYMYIRDHAISDQHVHAMNLEKKEMGHRRRAQ